MSLKYAVGQLHCLAVSHLISKMAQEHYSVFSFLFLQINTQLFFLNINFLSFIES